MNLFQKKSADAEEVYLNTLPEPARELVVSRFTSLTETVMSGVMDWGFEVVKHLAIFNGGGLAGAATLAQVAEKGSVAHALTLQAAHIFIFGLIVALFTMVSIYVTGLVFLRRFIEETMHISLSLRPLSALKLTWPFKVAVCINWSLAAISICLFLWGAFKIAAVA